MKKANLKILHPKSDSTGSAICIEMYYQTVEKPAYFKFIFAEQSSNDFFFEGGIECNLEFTDISSLLSVLKGKSENMNTKDLGDGIFFASQHIEKDDSYALAAIKNKDDDKRKIMIVLSKQETIGLMASIEQSMFFFSFIRGVNT